MKPIASPANHPPGAPSAAWRLALARPGFQGFPACLLLFATGLRLCAQPIISAPPPAAPGQPDPLAAFMISQPPIDTASPIVVSAEFDPPLIALGQSAVYRVVLNVLEQAIEWPETIPTPANVTLRRGGRGQFLQNLGTTVIPQTTFLYHLQPAVTGSVTLPAFRLRARGDTVQVPAATLTVVPPGSTVREPPTRIQLHSVGREFFVGQNVELRVVFPGRPDGTVQTLTQVEVVGEGLIMDRNFQAQRIESRVVNGVPTPTFIFESLATPMRPGKTEVIAQGFKIGNPFQGQLILSAPATMANLRPTYTLLDSEPLKLQILPLPAEAELPGFTGAIGTFSFDPPTLSTNRLQAGDLLTLRLVLRGSGNLERVMPPTIDSPPQWQVFQPQKENILGAIIRQRGFVTFEYKLLPLDDSIQATPGIPFSYFDPISRQYVDLSIPPQPLQVDPSPFAKPPVDQPSLVEARGLLRKLLQKPEEPTALAPTLKSRGRTATSLAPAHQRWGFAVVQLIPATLLGGLWFWDRRRRFLENHPEVVIRRRARKAIRRHARQARRAARQTNARQFLHHAIQAFREAGAPAAAADPRALVCADVLAAIPPALRLDPAIRVVTRLFTAANDWHFGALPPDSRELLGLAREVDQQLEILRKTL